MLKIAVDKGLYSKTYNQYFELNSGLPEGNISYYTAIITEMRPRDLNHSNFNYSGFGV